jgi:glycosyltransferase involved in cell wall biosynthesis
MKSVPTIQSSAQELSVKTAVVIPAFNEGLHIKHVLEGIPRWIQRVIVVDDGSNDHTADRVRECMQKDDRMELIQNPKNFGVGRSTLVGFERAVLSGADILVKLDGDGQMDPEYLSKLIEPLISGKADYAKGNRFQDFRALREMPLLRRLGNLGLSFFSKLASGYWNIFDPTNGYLAMRRDVFERLPLSKISSRFFFETSLLCELNLLGAVVKDVAMPARYNNEGSHLSVPRTLLTFPFLLMMAFVKRIILKHFIFDFSVIGLYLSFGLPMILGGLSFGIVKWVQYAELGRPAPTGTVILPTLFIILGFQLVLSAVNLDIQNTPKEPLNSGPLR